MERSDIAFGACLCYAVTVFLAF
jgi:hypothetical protein